LNIESRAVIGAENKYLVAHSKFLAPMAKGRVCGYRKQKTKIDIFLFWGPLSSISDPSTLIRDFKSKLEYCLSTLLFTFILP